MAFWIAAAITTLVVFALLALAVLRGRPEDTAGAAHDLRVYRDQLREVERDLARGTLPPEEAERLRAEVARRILEADRRRAAAAAGGLPASTPAAGRFAPLAGLALLLAAAAGAFAVYARVGAPGYADQPLADRIAAADALRAGRPSQAAAEAEIGVPPLADPPDPAYAELMRRLRETVAGRPDDAEGQRLLAQNEAALGNFAAAHRAQGARIRLLGAAATAEDHAVHADLLIRAAGGYVSPEAELALAEALRRDPRHGAARYYTGLLFLQTGRYDLMWRLWRPLMAESHPDDPWYAPLRAQIAEAAWRAGDHRYEPPAPPPRREPSAEALEAAAALSPEEREAMIRAMVSGLADRLAREGGPAADWARLITAYGVLGEREAAVRILAEARTVFAGRADDLAAIEAAAAAAGLAP